MGSGFRSHLAIWVEVSEVRGHFAVRVWELQDLGLKDLRLRASGV